MAPGQISVQSYWATWGPTSSSTGALPYPHAWLNTGPLPPPQRVHSQNVRWTGGSAWIRPLQTRQSHPAPGSVASGRSGQLSQETAGLPRWRVLICIHSRGPGPRSRPPVLQCGMKTLPPAPCPHTGEDEARAVPLPRSEGSGYPPFSPHILSMSYPSS